MNKFVKTDHYVIDYRKNTREYIATFYATSEVLLEEKKIVVTAANDKMPEATIQLEGQDLLSFKTYMAGNQSPVSAGRFLNSEYEEMIFTADLPDKGISVEGVVSKVTDTLFVAAKSIKLKSTGEIVAIAQETIHVISKEEFDKAVSSGGQ